MKRTIITCLSFILLLSCNKEIKELPEPTQTGAGTFGLKLNGTLWAPQGFAGIPDEDLLKARLLGDVLIITAQNFASSPTETQFDLHIKGITGTGTYSLNTNTGYPNDFTTYAYHVKRRLTPLDEWITSAAQTGTIIITRFDTGARIISGTFEFNAENMSDPSRTISVTEGRFDVKY